MIIRIALSPEHNDPHRLREIGYWHHLHEGVGISGLSVSWMCLCVADCELFFHGSHSDWADAKVETCRN